MRLEWSVYAVADREDIFTYIEVESPRAAISVDERIGEHVRQLLHYPESGREGRVEGTRELVVVRTPYVVVYRLAEEAVIILRVLHGARRWPDDGAE